MTCVKQRENARTCLILFFTLFSLFLAAVTQEQPIVEATVEVRVEEIEAENKVDESLQQNDEVVHVEEEKLQVDEVESYHLSADEIDEFEEAQAKFRTLWEKKREKVSVRDSLSKGGESIRVEEIRSSFLSFSFTLLPSNACHIVIVICS